MKRAGYVLLFLWLVFGFVLVLQRKQPELDRVYAGKTTITEAGQEEDGDGTAGNQQEAGQTDEKEDAGEKEEESKQEEDDQKESDEEQEETGQEESEEKDSASSGLTTQERIKLQQEIKQATEEKEQLEKEQQDLSRILKNLRKEKKTISGFIEALDSEMVRVQDEMDTLSLQIADSSERLSILETELALEEEREKSQYEIMKRRIKYMYEKGNSSYFTILFQSGSFTDFFNRAEYMKQITSYDSHMLANYMEVRQQTEETRGMVKAELSNQESMMQEKEIQQDEIEQMLQEKTRQMDKYKKLLKKTRNSQEEKENELQKQEDEIEALFAKQREKEGTGAITIPASGKLKGKYNLRWPLMVAGRISSEFGYRNSPTAGASTYHRGVDIAVPTGSYILAAQDGTVQLATYQSAAGNYVCISHGDGLYTYYMHCSKLLVSAGEKVKQGQVIAYSGSTGVSTGPHLHFGVNVGGEYIDPLTVVSPN